MGNGIDTACQLMTASQFERYSPMLFADRHDPMVAYVQGNVNTIITVTQADLQKLFFYLYTQSCKPVFPELGVVNIRTLKMSHLTPNTSLCQLPKQMSVYVLAFADDC